MFGLFRRRESAPSKVPGDAGLMLGAEATERRRQARQNTYADVTAASPNGHNKKRGIVLDLSDEGARLRFEFGDGMADGMVLKIPRYRVEKTAIVRWRTRTDVGVEFLG
ncbi:MAG: hypothetical protein AAGF20_13090 [Pseudomonadota bacterium]